MKSEYIKALEIRVQWLQWAIEEGYLSHAPDVVLNNYSKNLKVGDTFFMNKNFCSLVEHARLTVPDELVFDSNWLQSKYGWLWIEEPFVVPDIEAKESQSLYKLVDHVKISAIGWMPIPEGLKTEKGFSGREGRIAGPGATHFLMFQDFNLHKPGVRGFGCWSYFMLMDGDKLLERIHQFEESTGIDEGKYKIDRSSDMLHEIRWVYAAFYLMAQRLSVNIHHKTDRSTKRRGIREDRPVPDFIRIVSLRRLEADRKREGAVEKVEWQWQWEVRGHWRNQWYSSEGIHKPKFVEAYIKGPQDKPLKPPGHKLFVAVR